MKRSTWPRCGSCRSSSFSRTTAGRRAHHRHANLAGSMRDRFTAFGLPVFEIDSTDVEELDAVAGRALDAGTDATGRRVSIVVHTYRLCHHSKNDDNRPAGEVAARWQLDPLDDPRPSARRRLARSNRRRGGGGAAGR